MKHFSKLDFLCFLSKLRSYYAEFYMEMIERATWEVGPKKRKEKIAQEIAGKINKE